VIVEHRRAHIDEEVEAVRMREHPVLAVRTVELAMLAVQAAQHRLALRDRKTVGRNR
jgi:hypothetical protein